MSRRVSLPGADELFRTTGGMALQSSSPRRGANGTPAGGETPRVPAPGGEPDPAADAPQPETTPRPRQPADGETPGTRSGENGAGPDAGTAAPVEHSGRETEPQAPAQTQAPKGRRRQEPAENGTAAAPAAAQQTGQPRRRGRGANRRPSGRERHDEKITVYVSAEELMDLEHARLVLRGEHGLAVDRGRIVREAVAVVLADLESRGDASILVRRLRGR
ncbi:hypothetical protein [Streptomyces sp. MST-110588]|uniref:hypothetical protein n=1 Tax=Streptomyces sp. MST-110588 TaxID=2833628 RepID=UPI001F5C7E82|nr:hypothetical protein [Streptomyces sp. MST-110588]UNO42850.1 hypothetical protein KGS77_29215 [Streptomyces sp. MST-110588]